MHSVAEYYTIIGSDKCCSAFSALHGRGHCKMILPQSYDRAGHRVIEEYGPALPRGTMPCGKTGL